MTVETVNNSVSEPTVFQETYSCGAWCDHITLRGAEALARFGPNGPAAGLPALTYRSYGAGAAYFIATILEDRFYEEFFRTLQEDLLPIRPLSADGDLEIVPVRDGNERLYFVLNHVSVPRKAAIDGRFLDILDDSRHTYQVDMTPFGVRLLAPL